MIKPEFFESDTLARLSLPSNLLFIGIWCFSDDYGSYYYNSRRILGDLFPNRPEITEKMVKEWILELLDANVLKIYEISGKTYLQTTNWTEHQRVDKPSKRRNPPFDLESQQDTKTLSSGSRGSRVYNKKEKEKEKKKVGRPTVQDVSLYVKENSLNVDPIMFHKFFTTGKDESKWWIDTKGNPVKNWKQKLLTWHNKNNSGVKPLTGQIPKTKYCKDQWFDKDNDQMLLCGLELGHKKKHEFTRLK